MCTVFDAVLSSIDGVLLFNPSVNLFVFGDFNVHHKNWLAYYGTTDRSDELCYSLSIADNLPQSINFSTWISMTITALLV